MTSCVDPVDQKPVMDIKPEMRSLESEHPSTLVGPPPDPLKSPASQFYLPDMYGVRDPLAGLHPAYNHHVTNTPVNPAMVRYSRYHT